MRHSPILLVGDGVKAQESDSTLPAIMYRESSDQTILVSRPARIFLVPSVDSKKRLANIDKHMEATLTIAT